MTENNNSPGAAIKALLDVMKRLRDPETGCPWDVEQNFRSIAPYTIEEAYEVADAIEREDFPALKDELGDLLFQAVFHSQMADEAGLFNFTDVAQGITEKMTLRHPHVFGDADVRSAEEQTREWESQKAQEREAKGMQSLLDDVPPGLPGLTRAVKLQKRAARVGFDWKNAQDVLDKIKEECDELAEAVNSKDADAIEDEFGDLLFVIANLSRHLSVDPEAALRRANEKFITRFQFIEKNYDHSAAAMKRASLEELEALWQKAKQSSHTKG